MSFKIKLIFVLLLGITFNNINAQDCTSIREKAIELETDLDENNPQAYYEYAMYIRKQVVAGNNCINKDIINSVYNLLVEGANNGSIRCAARLAMIYQYGLYNYPTHHAKAFEISDIFMGLAYNTFESDLDLYNEFGYIIPTLYLHNYNQYTSCRDNSTKSPEFTEAVFIILFKDRKAPEIKETDPNSYKLIKQDYSKVLAHAYLTGDYSTKIDYTKGIQLANKIGQSYRNNWIIKLLKDHNNDVEFSNPAALTFLGAAEGKSKYAIEDVDEYSNTIYQANINKVKSKLLFEQSYLNISAPLKEIIDAAYPSYIDITKKWELVNTSRLREPDSYPQWKFLPRDEQDRLFAEALKGENSTLKEKEQFQIYKAMVESGQNKALMQLAKAYKHGIGVFPMGAQAITTFTKALNFETFKEEAAWNLAEIYDGALEDVDVNWVKAAKYYKMATNYNPKAYTMLGEMALFGVGGYEQNRTTAMEYINKGHENGDKDAANKYEIIQSIPYLDNEVVRENYTLSLENTEELQVRKISDANSLTITVNYNVPQGLEKNTLKIYPDQEEDYAIKYGTWSPSAILKGEGQEKVIIYNNTFRKGSRQIRDFYILGDDHDGDWTALYQIPIAVCFLPQKM